MLLANICTASMWFALKTYTVLELKSQRLVQWLKEKGFLPQHKQPIIDDDDEHNHNDNFDSSTTAKWLFIKEGSALSKPNMREGIHAFDLIFYALPSVNGSTTMVRITVDTKAFQLFQLQECPLKIYACNLNINDGEYILNISHKGMNFMIAGNTLYDRVFWQWYLLNIERLFLEDTDRYRVTFFDDQMNVVIFDDTQLLRLTDTGYFVEDATTTIEKGDSSVAIEVLAPNADAVNAVIADEIMVNDVFATTPLQNDNDELLDEEIAAIIYDKSFSSNSSVDEELVHVNLLDDDNNVDIVDIVDIVVDEITKKTN